MMGVSTAGVRSLIQGLLDSHDCLSQEEIQTRLGLDYHTVNRALNSPPNTVLGETPFARTDNPGDAGTRWVWFAVRPENPLTQREFDIKTKTAHTQLTKTRDQLLRPAIAAGAVATGDGDALDESLTYLDASITALDTARLAGERKAEVLRVQRENAARTDELARQEAEVEAERKKLEAQRKEFEKQEAELEKRQRALRKARQSKVPPVARIKR